METNEVVERFKLWPADRTLATMPRRFSAESDRYPPAIAITRGRQFSSRLHFSHPSGQDMDAYRFRGGIARVALYLS